RLQTDQQLGWRPPLLQPATKLGIALGGSRKTAGTLPHGPIGRVQGTDQMAVFGPITPHHAANRGSYQSAHLGFHLINRQSPALSAAVTLSIGARPEVVGAGVPPATVPAGEAGRGVFARRSSPKENQRPFPARFLGESFCRLSALFYYTRRF